ncbi:MAG: pyrroline-5-carboxylate reductase [Gammaproteobacteria bacterium]|nr:pyrroline-5-carboxylate reductase [Gammaproteobacteria bacterium]NND53735.1 pyrroline-5-carboxylate reductase [Gammaproteobacteria bacterium]
MNELSIGFVGGGNMAQAIIRGLLAAGHRPDRLYVSDPSAESRQALAEMHGNIRLQNDNAELAGLCDVLVLAVKPQVLPDVARQLATTERAASQLVISIAAGVTMASLRGWFSDSKRIVRVMPNTPALIGAGMAGLYADHDLDSIARGWADYVMEATGESLWVSDEALIDAVTAVSGSGPAYFFLVMEAMQEVAMEMGFDEQQARLLTTRTAAGAGLLASASDESAAVLRERVTSPGGTTAAALEQLEQGGIRDIFRKALNAAQKRAVELGKHELGDS